MDIIILLFWWFFTAALIDGFSLEFPQDSRTLLSILADLNVVFWIVSTCLLISKSSSSCTKLSVTELSVPIIIGITVIFMSHSFSISLARSRYSCLFSLSFSFALWSAGTAKSTIQLVLLFIYSCWLSLGLIVWLRLGDPFLYQNPREVCTSHFLGLILGCAYTIL